MDRTRAVLGITGVSLMFFAAAREGVCAVPEPPPDAAAVSARPRVLRRKAPDYPPALAFHGNDGDVEAAFVVTREGRVRDIVLVSSPHPLFERATVAALLKWEFAPATRDGVAVDVAARQQFRYQFVRKGVSPFVVRAGRSSSRAETAATLPQLKLATQVVYPRDLRLSQVQGHAKVWIRIGPDGQVYRAETVEATQPEFGFATEAALANWVFEPARADGTPVASELVYEQAFGPDEREFLTDRSTSRIIKALRRNPVTMAAVAELDHRPVPRYAPAPLVIPGHAHAAERVRVDFIIDGDGLTQLPHSVTAHDRVLAWAAASAVARWQFEAPLKNGKPVDVRAQMAFDFTASEDASADASADGVR